MTCEGRTLKNTKEFLALLLAVVMVFALAACGEKPTDPSQAADPTNSTKPVGGTNSAGTADPTAPAPANPTNGITPAGKGLELVVNLTAEPQTIDPALNVAVDGSIMLQHTFEGLMTWVDSGVAYNDSCNAAALALGQAEGYDRVENGDGTVTYTFHLRDGIKWSDGLPVTAQDFVYAWKRLVNPATGADYNYMLNCVVNATEIMVGLKEPSELAVSAPDEKTFVVTVNDVPYFTEICAFPATFPVRQDIIEAYGDQWVFNPTTYIGNGPYQVSAWNYGAEIVMVPSATYYEEVKGPASITFKVMDDEDAVLSGFRSGELDFVADVPKDEVAGLLSGGELDMVDYVSTYYLCFQTQEAPFDDPLVRKAFALAIDRSFLVEQVTRSGEAAAGGLVPAGVYDAAGVTGDDFRTVGGDYYDLSGEAYTANCEEARRLLAEAGYPNGEGFPVVDYLYNTSDVHRAVAEALQDMWQQQLGVTVSLNDQTWSEFLQTRKAGDFSIARGNWRADYNDPISFLDMWITDDGGNDGQYANPDYDALIQQAEAATDPVERMELLHQAEDLIIGEDFALCPLYFYTQKYMISDRVGGLLYTPLGYFLFGSCYGK